MNAEKASQLEIRGVETIEEFFRPEFAQNTQSLEDINDDSEIDFAHLEDDSNQNTNLKIKNNDTKLSNRNQFFQDDQLHEQKAQIRGMGFPNMKHLDPDAVGPPVQSITLYKEYENNQNDIKQQREGFINARDNMPNNTFIKLFHNFSAEENQKQDELQSIQYVDQNYVESSVDTENEFDRREG